MTQEQKDGQTTDFAGKSEKFCKAEETDICLTMSETKWAFAERKIRSLKYPLLLHGRLWKQVPSQWLKFS